MTRARRVVGSPVAIRMLGTSMPRIGPLAALLIGGLLASGLVGCSPSTTEPPAPKPLEGWTTLVDGYTGGGITAAWSAGAAGAQRSWALVGGDGANGVILELSGSTWTRHTIAGVGLLWWVHGDAAGNRAAVGDGGALVTWKAGDSAPKVTRIKALQDANVALYGVWFAPGATEYWVVGGNPKVGVGTGIAWQIPASSLDADPAASATRVDVGDKQGILFKIIGVGEERWAVGDGGVIWHGKGATWAVEATIDTDVLIGIAGDTSDHLVTVGGRGAGVVARRSASGWAQVAGGKDSWISGLSAVTLLPSGVALVGGTYGFLGMQDATTPKDDLPGLDPPLTTLTLHGAWSDAHTQVMVGGSFDNPAAPIVGCVLMRGAALPALP